MIPLHANAAAAVEKDLNFYELLALVDTLREGRPRESEIAVQELNKRFARYQQKR